jgi:uncharacterized transporter YbjL
VVLTSPDVLGKRIGELNLLAAFGISIYRVSRHGVEFVPNPKTILQQADILTVEGPHDNKEQFKKFEGMAVIITIVPMISGYGFAIKVLKLTPFKVLGGICGGMTSTPGLGAVSESVDSEVPAMSYAAAYPAALILMTVFTQIIVRVLG